MAVSNIVDLLDEILVLIFRHLDQPSRLEFALVCRRFLQIFQDPISWERLEFQACRVREPLAPALKLLLSRAMALRHLSISYDCNDYERIPRGERFYAQDLFKYLRTSMYNITSLKFDFKNREGVRIPCRDDKTDFLLTLPRLSNLVHLDLRDCSWLEDDSMKIIASHLPKLQKLNVSYAQGTYRDFDLSTVCKEVCEDCYVPYGLTDESLVYLSEVCPLLTWLDISAARFTFPGLVKMANNLPNLVVLEAYIFYKLEASEDELHGSSLLPIVPHKKLKELYVYQSKLSDKAAQLLFELFPNLEVFSGFITKGEDLMMPRSKLKTLVLHFPHNDGLPSTTLPSLFLSQFPDLEELILSEEYDDPDVSSQVFSLLPKSCPLLQTLSWKRYSGYAKECLESLSQLKHLQSLNLGLKDGLAKDCLESLSQLEHLQSLNLGLKDDGFDIIFSGCRNLQKLIATCHKIQLENMSMCSQIKELTIQSPEIKLTGPISIVMPSLCKLYLDHGININDYQLSILADLCPNLEEFGLSVSGNRLTANGWKGLSGKLTHLKQLDYFDFGSLGLPKEIIIAAATFVKHCKRLEHICLGCGNLKDIFKVDPLYPKGCHDRTWMIETSLAHELIASCPKLRSINGKKVRYFVDTRCNSDIANADYKLADLFLEST